MRAVPALALAAALAGCTTPPAPPPAGAADWQPVLLPGKRATVYQWVEKDGRRAVLAQSDRSASMWRQRVRPPLQAARELQFSWWLPELNAAARVAEAERGDASVRVLLGFGGDVSALPLRTRMLFDLAQALTGEAPPYATLAYVWDPVLPVGSVVPDPRTDRIRKIVVESGAEGLRRWRDHRRDLAADFERAFGEKPGPLLHVALMTDSDNTGTTARAWYGPVELR
ncbi:DUF3047 domain-containing protein [Ideonella sp.]|uniref:DUF3047 domain-containing protein n=1 Tax=Ideonella sp. TaxID=1929293 RepID=UPI0035B367D9